MLDAIENRGIHNAAGTVSIRRLKAQDVPAAVRLTQAVRWPHTEEDWRLHLQLGQGWVANDSGALLGTAMTWPYGQAAGTTGLIVVDQAQQGRGIARRLFARALEDLGSRAVQLVATDAGLRLNRSFCFEITATIAQHQGHVRPVPAHENTEAIGIRAVCDADTETLIEIDAAASGAERAALIRAVLPIARGVVLERHGKPPGFALQRPSGRGQTIGPVVAPDESMAQALIRSLLATSSRFVRVDVPANERKLAACLVSCGLVQVDRGLLMTRGKWPSSRNSVRRFALVSRALG